MTIKALFCAWSLLKLTHRSRNLNSVSWWEQNYNQLYNQLVVGTFVFQTPSESEGFAQHYRVFLHTQLMDMNIRNLRLLQFSVLCTDVKRSAQIHWVLYTARGSFCHLNLRQTGQYPLLSSSQGFPTVLCWCSQGARGQFWCSHENDGQVSPLCGDTVSDIQRQNSIFAMTGQSQAVMLWVQSSTGSASNGKHIQGSLRCKHQSLDQLPASQNIQSPPLPGKQQYLKKCNSPEWAFKKKTPTNHAALLIYIYCLPYICPRV